MAAKLTRGSVALVTASSAGLGAATAQALASQGVRVVINYHSSKEKADSILETLAKADTDTDTAAAAAAASPKDATPRFHAVKADCSKRRELISLVEETVKTMGRLDLVVSNHGWTKMRNFKDLDDNVEESDWDICFNMNVKSHLFLFHAARKYLEESGGSFITTASVAGVKPSGSSVAYSVTKAVSGCDPGHCFVWNRSSPVYLLYTGTNPSGEIASHDCGPCQSQLCLSWNTDDGLGTFLSRSQSRGLYRTQSFETPCYCGGCRPTNHPAGEQCFNHRGEFRHGCRYFYLRTLEQHVELGTWKLRQNHCGTVRRSSVRLIYPS